MTDLDRVALVIELIRLEDLQVQYAADKRDPTWALSRARMYLSDARMAIESGNYWRIPRMRTDLYEARKYLAYVSRE